MSETPESKNIEQLKQLIKAALTKEPEIAFELYDEINNISDDFRARYSSILPRGERPPEDKLIYRLSPKFHEAAFSTWHKDSTEKIRDYYRNKGWSDEKIDQYVTEIDAEVERRAGEIMKKYGKK